jgi:hypothetical protein
MKEYANYTDQELQLFWVEFSNIPVNDLDEIEEDFHFFQKGTDRQDIWAWFDCKHSIGVSQLLI